MRILMTGHLGYIGTAAVPMFQARGHEVVGLDTDLYRDCTFGPRSGRRRRSRTSRHRHPGRDAGPPRGLRRGGAPRRAVQRPPGQPRPRADAGDQHGRGARASPAPPSAPACRASSSPPPAATTARRGTTSSTRPRSSAPSRPTAAPRPPRRPSSAAAGGRAVLAGADALLDRLRRVAAAPLRPGGQQPDRLGGGDRRHLPEERRQPLAGDRPHRGHRARLPRRVPRRRARRSTCKPSTSARPPRITASSRSPGMVEEVVPGARIRFAPDAGPDPRCYRVNCDKLARTLPDARARWTARQGIEQLYDAFSPPRRRRRRSSRGRASRARRTSAP